MNAPSEGDLALPFPWTLCIYCSTEVTHLPLFPLEWQILELPSHPPVVLLSPCSSEMKCCRTSFKGLFWPGSSWASCPPQWACSVFWQDYECLLSTNCSYHKTQIKMDRYIFNEFINLKGFGFLLKQASGFPSHALASLGYFRITVCSFPQLSQHNLLHGIGDYLQWGVGFWNDI